jgi:hypothetical protein
VAVSYDVVTRARDGREHVRRYTSDDALAPGSILVLDGRYFIVEGIDGTRARAWPARYRLTLRHPDGHEETGAFRRFRADAPLQGHQLSTVEGGAPVSWVVLEQRLARDDAGEPFLETIAERDYAEVESLPEHQLEHALAQEGGDAEAAAAVLRRAEEAGLAVELVALEPGQAADWEEAGRFVDALVLEEVSDDLLTMSGVDPSRDPRDSWLETVQQRLRDDLASFRADIEGAHAEIEEWDFGGGRVFAAVGRVADESSPLRGYGWMCRLVDADALGAAGFGRVRKAFLLP